MPTTRYKKLEQKHFTLIKEYYDKFEIENLKK